MVSHVIRIMQVYSDAVGDSPFLVMNEKKVLFFPLRSLHKEAQGSSDPTLLSEVPHLSLELEFPLEKWVHFGCEVCFADNKTSFPCSRVRRSQ